MLRKLFIFAISAMLHAALFAETTRVACVGDSITFGDGVENRDENNYPRQLQNAMGDKFGVGNFGVCGAALAKNSAGPYWDEDAYKNSLDFAPNIVIIKLGTNDSNPINWGKSEQVFEGDLNALIDSYEALPSKPEIYLCLPVKCFGNPNADENAMIKLRGIILNVAKKRGLKAIDLYTPLKDRNDLFKDNLHPNAEGAKIIAETVLNFLKENSAFKAKIGTFSEQ